MLRVENAAHHPLMRIAEDSRTRLIMKEEMAASVEVKLARCVAAGAGYA